MKRTYALMISLSMMCASFMVCSSITPGVATKSPKRIACEQGCQEAFDTCKKKAGNSQAKISACQAARTACMNKCSEY